jgi:hypothetical protein
VVLALLELLEAQDLPAQQAPQVLLVLLDRLALQVQVLLIQEQ